MLLVSVLTAVVAVLAVLVVSVVIVQRRVVGTLTPHVRLPPQAGRRTQTHAHQTGRAL
jgi:hypothetical protein